MSDDARTRLGLKDGDSFEIVLPHEDYLVIKKKNAGSKGKIALLGELGALSISDLFSILNITQKGGVLHIFSEDIKKSIYFRRGEIVFASSNLTEERLGHVLYRTGKITQEQLKKAESEVDSKTRFGGILLKNKFITPKDLWWGIKYQLEEIIFSIFSITSGAYIFIDGDFLPPDLTRLSLNTQNLLMEGLKRMDEWNVIKDIIPSNNILIGIGDEPITVELTPTLQKIISCIEGRASVGEVIKKAQLGEFNTYKLLYQLVKARVLKVVEKEEKPTVEDGTKRLSSAIEKYNHLYSFIVQRIHEEVPDFKLSDSLPAFFDDLTDKQKRIFNKVKIDKNGMLTTEHIMHNIDKIKLVESEKLSKIAGFAELMLSQYLLEGLNEFLNFHIFLARNILPETKGEELAREVRKMQQSVYNK
ncbi:MAG TPA: DUF4388 domain-containing protein [bacterium]